MKPDQNKTEWSEPAYLSDLLSVRFRFDIKAGMEVEWSPATPHNLPPALVNRYRDARNRYLRDIFGEIPIGIVET